MYYGVEDFLEKTAKTRLAKEFSKVYDDYIRLTNLPKTNLRNKALMNASAKAERLSPFESGKRYSDLFTNNFHERLDPDFVAMHARRRFTPAESIDPRSKELRALAGQQASRNYLSKADRDLIKKYL